MAIASRWTLLTILIGSLALGRPAFAQQHSMLDSAAIQTLADSIFGAALIGKRFTAAALVVVGALFHTGDGGHHSIIYFVPERHFGLYAVYATGDEEASRLREELVTTLVAGALSATMREAMSEPPSDFAMRADEYVGTYRTNSYSHFTLEKIGALPMQLSIASDDKGALLAWAVGIASLKQMNRKGRKDAKERKEKPNLSAPAVLGIPFATLAPVGSLELLFFSRFTYAIGRRTLFDFDNRKADHTDQTDQPLQADRNLRVRTAPTVHAERSALSVESV